MHRSNFGSIQVQFAFWSHSEEEGCPGSRVLESSPTESSEHGAPSPLSGSNWVSLLWSVLSDDSAALATEAGSCLGWFRPSSTEGLWILLSAFCLGQPFDWGHAGVCRRKCLHLLHVELDYGILLFAHKGCCVASVLKGFVKKFNFEIIKDQITHWQPQRLVDYLSLLSVVSKF